MSECKKCGKIDENCLFNKHGEPLCRNCVQSFLIDCDIRERERNREKMRERRSHCEHEFIDIGHDEQECEKCGLLI